MSNASEASTGSNAEGQPAEKGRHRLAGLTLAALGICFGDIGTSPLYAIRECFHSEYGIAANSANILEVLSLGSASLWAGNAC
jgi:KUP system potassium uptake protein